MTSNLQLQLEAGKTYAGWGSYNDGTTFDLVPVESTSTTSSWYSCSTDGTCAFNNNTIVAGGWYNWYAATGGKGKSTDGAGVDINGSICPKGWKLPYNYTVDNNKSYQKLVDDYSATSYDILEAVPLSFSRAGWYETGRSGYSGTYGFYWSSTASATANAYHLRYYSPYSGSYGKVEPQVTNPKYLGFPVRCVNIY